MESGLPAARTLKRKGNLPLKADEVLLPNTASGSLDIISFKGTDGDVSITEGD